MTCYRFVFLFLKSWQLSDVNLNKKKIAFYKLFCQKILKYVHIFMPDVCIIKQCFKSILFVFCGKEVSNWLTLSCMLNRNCFKTFWFKSDLRPDVCSYVLINYNEICYNETFNYNQCEDSCEKLLTHIYPLNYVHINIKHINKRHLIIKLSLLS